jgi:predicted MFS family arabinose efflux permease
MTSKEKILLLTLAAVQFTHIVDFMIIMPLGPQLMRLFDINPQQFSIIVSSYTFSAGICGFLAAFFMDKFDRKVLLMYTYIGFSVGTFACAFATSYELLVAARIFTGAFGGVLGSLVLAILGDAIPLERRATAMGTVMAAFSLASVLGVPFGLFLANSFDWHAPFLFLGGFTVLVMILITIGIPEMSSHIEAKKSGENPFKFLADILANGNQVRALLLMVFLVFGHFTVIPFISPYMVSNVGFSESQLTYIYLLGGGVTIFTSPFIGKLADKIGKVKVYTIFCLLTMIPIFIITNIGKTEIWLVLIVNTFFFIVMGGRMIPASTMITAAVAPRNRGSFMSINSCVQQLSSAFASLISGLIISKSADGLIENYQYVGYLAIFCGFVSIFLAQNIKSVDQT